MVRRKVAKKKNQAKVGIVKYFLQQPDTQNVSFKYSAMPNSPQSTKEEAQRIQDSIGIGHCTIGVALKEMVADGLINSRRDDKNNAIIYSLDMDKCQELIQEVQSQLPIQPTSLAETTAPLAVNKETEYMAEETPDFWQLFFEQFFNGLTGMMVETFKFTLNEDRNSRREIFEKVINRFQKQLQEKEEELNYLTGKFKELKAHKEQLTETEAKRFKGRIAELEKQLELANHQIGKLNNKLNTQGKPQIQWVQKYAEDMGKNLKVTLGDLIKKAGPEGAADTEAIF